MAEWLKATDCKSVLFGVRRFETYSAHSSFFITSGSSSFGRAVAFQASGGRFEPGLPLFVVGNSQSAVANCFLQIVPIVIGKVMESDFH
jgi:hypothetical protein